MKNLVLALAISLTLAACGDGGMQGLAGGDAGAIDAEAVAVDSQPAVVGVDAQRSFDTAPIPDASQCFPGTHSIGIDHGKPVCVLDTPDANPDADPCGPLAVLVVTLDSGVHMCGPLPSHDAGGQ